MSELRSNETREIQRALDELRLEVEAIRRQVGINRMLEVQPKSPQPGDFWRSDGAIKIYHPNGIETYSKD